MAEPSGEQVEDVEEKADLRNTNLQKLQMMQHGRVSGMEFQLLLVLQVNKS